MIESMVSYVAIILLLCCGFNFIKHRELKAKANIDFLTGLYTRKIFPQIESNEKTGCRYLIIVCDIDHFKSVNDTYGHSTGDLVLKTVAETIKSSFKSSIDYVVRFGGEEFIVFVKDSKETRDIIVQRTEDVRKKIEELNILTQDMKLIKVTSSFGISMDVNASIKDRIDIADGKLYKAKETGRNRVIW